MSNLSVRYVGLKPQRTDTIAGTGLTWYGHGDIQSVTAAAWDKLKRHSDVWELVDTTAEPAKTAGTLAAASVVDENDHGKTIDNWRTEEDPAKLRAMAKAAGVAVHHKVNDVDKIRALIAAGPAEKVEA